jgi:hypothetical protein
MTFHAYAECHYTVCRYDKCHKAECRGAVLSSIKRIKVRNKITQFVLP